MRLSTKLSGTSDAEIFHPSFLLKNATLQSILGSLRLRACNARAWCADSREIRFSIGSGVRLQGFYTLQSFVPPKGLVILLHGWEGSAESTYVLTTGKYLFLNGFDILRLNYKDHGRSHHLNTGLFFATNLSEVLEAVRQGAALSKGAPVYIVGFSMGGNFALRIALKCADVPIADLKHIVAVSPVLEPARATDCIDKTPLFREYFLKKWRRSLKIKQRLFPDRYNFNNVLRSNSCREMTEAILPFQSTYPSVEDYFNGYRLTGAALECITLPTTIITAADDPIIPVDDFTRLRLSLRTRLIIHRHGGHNGFVLGLFSPTWHETFMLRSFGKEKAP